MSLARSDRFYWCTGCGKWHDPLKGQAVHYSMCWPWQEPTARNFEGTEEELKRFLAARDLKRQDAEAFEHRIDEQLK